jgi:2-polyprenyl-3-methyl-5-hydroxy-6-metoxy-1,4-benzoquinol methylase
MASKRDKDTLVSRDFWEKPLSESPFVWYLGIEKYLAMNKKFDKLFKKFLKRGNKKILEIGCTPAKRLIYFAKEFGYKVYGIDYAEKGIDISKENLRIAGVEGTILCEDVFQTSFEDESFDIVYSMGLVEHFESPAEIIDAHIKLLKRGGTLIITIPNFKDSLYFTLSKIFGEEKRLVETHNLDIMDKKRLNELLQSREIEVLLLDYFGPIDLTISCGGTKIKPVSYLIHILNQILGYASFFVPKSRYFSPHLILIAKRSEV